MYNTLQEKMLIESRRQKKETVLRKRGFVAEIRYLLGLNCHIISYYRLSIGVSELILNLPSVLYRHLKKASVKCLHNQKFKAKQKDKKIIHFLLLGNYLIGI